MNMINRGLKSLMGHKIKTVILLLLIIILGSVTASAIIMTNGIHSTANHLRRSIPAIVMRNNDVMAAQSEAGYTLEEIMDGALDRYFHTLTREMVYEIGALPYVRGFSYTYAFYPFMMQSFDLNEYTPENWEQIIYVNMFLLTGVTRPSFIQIEEDIWELVAGRLFTEDEMYLDESREYAPILITESVANLNGVSVGSTLTLYKDIFELPENAVIPENGFSGLELENIWEHEYYAYVQIPFSFEVVGIISMPYEPNYNVDRFLMQHWNQNRFIIPNWKVNEINNVWLESRIDMMTVFNIENIDEEIAFLERFMALVTPTWVLYDIADFEAFAAQANEILPEFSIMEDMSFTQQDVLTSMGSVNSLMNQVLIVAIGATLIVLTLTILLYLRDRKHEIGVYLALGERKRKIILQILFEVLSVTTTGIIIAVFIGNVVSNQMSDFLLREAFISTQEACDFPTTHNYCWNPRTTLEWSGFGIDRVQMEFDELIEIFDVSLDIRAITIFSGIALATTVLSTIVPVMYILELNPKEILLRGNIG